MEWKPIETAPLDTNVLIKDKDGDFYVARLWTYNGRWKREQSDWIINCTCTHAEGSNYIEPVLWMELSV